MAIAFTSPIAQAQMTPPDTDWKESPVPAAPALSNAPLISIDMPSFLSLQVGVDPQSLTVSADGIVRYVVVAKSTGANNAMYEGIRCATSEFITYARATFSGPWIAVKETQWRPLNSNNASRHALALARQGACEGRSVGARNAAQIVEALRNSAKTTGI